MGTAVMVSKLGEEADTVPDSRDLASATGTLKSEGQGGHIAESGAAGRGAGADDRDTSEEWRCTMNR